ncbi:MAG: type IV toxin-antitoxin system AbiEi family antitoxin domain-containing protein [bacterium]
MGSVTTGQAGTVGVSSMALVMMARRGTLERVSRGVYRLVDFPVQPLAQYMQATLWPYGHRGILSHETALSLHELSDVDPAKVHITVPAAFRVQRAIPGYLVVHHAGLSPEDVTRLEGMPITSVVRTIRDCIREHLGPALLTPAIQQARMRGLLDPATAIVLEHELRSATTATRSRTVP